MSRYSSIALSPLLLSLTMLGCMRPTYSTTIVADADYGREISQSDAEAGAMAFMASYLKDPRSAQYQWSSVKKAWIHMQPTAFKPRTYGYALEGRINGKNSYGGYVGFKPYRFFFRDRQLVQVAEAQANEFRSNGIMWWQVSPPPP